MSGLIDNLTWRSGAARVAQTIGARIVRGEYQEGTRLPLEEDLARELLVSRNTLREAMKLLAAKSLILIRPRRGTVVLHRAEWNILDADVIDWFGTTINSDPMFMLELGQTRQIIEPAAAFEAAIRANCVEVEAIANAYAVMSALSPNVALEETVSADLAFHLAVADASGNRFLQSITRSISHALRKSFEALIEPPGNYEANLANHLAVLDAVRRREAEEAYEAMSTLLQRSAFATKRLQDAGGGKWVRHIESKSGEPDG